MKNFIYVFAAVLAMTSQILGGVVPVPSAFEAGSDQTDARMIYVGQSESGGLLAIDNHAEFMVARDDNNVALNWNNCGTFKWSFGFFGFDGPKSEYPQFEGNLSGSPAVTFDGNDKMRMIMEPGYGYTLPAEITDGVLSIEMWVINPTVETGEILIRFEDTVNYDLTVDPFSMAGSSTWQHLVAVSDGSQISYYLNNVLVATQAGSISFGPNAVINLGAQSLTGSIAAFRFHTEVMNTTDIAHNYAGGVGLGTFLFWANSSAEPCNSFFGNPELCPDLSWYESAHFRSMWKESENPDPGDDIGARIQNSQLAELETVYTYLNEKSGKHLPLVSKQLEKRGDGRKYKWLVGNGWSGSWSGNSPMGLGYGITYAGYVNPHEYIHGTDSHQMGNITGHWWESHANFQVSWLGEPQVNPVTNCPKFAHVYPSTGGNYYHAYLIWDHLVEEPEFTGLYVTRLWNMGPNAGNAEGLVFPPQGMKDIDPSPATPFEEEWVKMAARNVTWDYPSHPEYKTKYDTLPYTTRDHLTRLEQVPYLATGWYEPPEWRTPQQHGYNLCPLEVNVGTVTADLVGFYDAEHDSEWMGTFVAVESDGSPRYGSIFDSSSQGSFDVLAGDQELYLIVVAAPQNIMEILIFNDRPTADYRHPSQDRFPYQVQLGGTTPKASLWQPTPGIDGTVAPTAYVSPTAYIGSNAQILDNARVEDYAVVYGTVQGNAIVSDYAVVESGAVVRDDARVTDYAVIGNNCVIENDAHIMEHAFIGDGVKISEYAVCKGNSIVNGPVYGTGIIDGNYIKNNEIDKGYWFVWSWGSGQSAGELDQEFYQLYSEYLFEKQDDYRIWDTYGATWGRLINGPVYVADNGGTALELDGSDDFVDLHRSIGNFETITFDLDVKWDGGANDQKLISFSNSTTGDTAWLSPSDSSGKLAFSIDIGGNVQTLQAANPLPSGEWKNVKLMTYNNTVILHVDDVEWAIDNAFTHDIEDVNADECYIGRDASGNYYDGRIDNFTVWSRSLLEYDSPTPNPAEFAIEPATLDGNVIMMQATPATDTSYPLEYYFEETSGNPGGSDSGWQISPLFYDGGLAPDTQYTYRVKVRDALGNETAFSSPVNYTAPTTHPGYFIQEVDGSVSIEAENFDHNVTGTMYSQSWTFINSIAGYSGTGAMHVPNAGKQINSLYAPDVSPRLGYNVKFDQAGTYYMYVRGHGPNGSGNSCHGGLDMQEIDSLNLIANFDVDGTYNWKGGQAFDVPHAGVHRVNIWMREDATYIDKIVIKPTTGLPGGTGPAESARGGGDPVQVISPPATPANVSATTGPGYIDLDWDDNTEPELLGYHVYRSEIAGGPYARVTENMVTTSSYQDANVNLFVTYYYVVKAFAEGLMESSYSTEINGFAEMTQIEFDLSVTDNSTDGTLLPDSGAIVNGATVSDLMLTWNGLDFGGTSLDLVISIDAYDVDPLPETNIDIQDVNGDNGLNPRGALNRPQDDEQFDVTISLFDGMTDVTEDWIISVADIQTKNQPKTNVLRFEILGSTTAFLFDDPFDGTTSFKNWASEAGNSIVDGPYEMIGQAGGVGFRMGVDSVTDAQLLHWSGIKLLFKVNDLDPPTPNPATWETVPTALGQTAITMTATTGSDVTQPVLYFFDETSGNPGGTDSGWISSATYTDYGLLPDTTYTYTVTMRDAVGNIGSVSSSQNATTDPVDPKLAVGMTTATNSWATITLTETYDSMVVVATPLYTSADDPMVVRIRNAAGSSFDVRVDPAGGMAPGDTTVYYMVVEEGVYNSVDHGVTMEAASYTSTVTDSDSSWVGQQVTPVNSYTNPVVLGQVMSYNDPDFSVFWCRGATVADPPDGTNIFVGKTTCEDPDPDRSNETVGFIIIEAGSGVVDGIPFAAALGGDSVQGVTNSPPYTYSVSGVSGAGFAILSQAAMDGGNGGWSILYDADAISDTQLKLAIDEDVAADTERDHTAEQVGYIVFADITPPTPNPATWASVPAALSDTAITMTATTGADDSGTVEYYFDETSGNPGGSDSGWQSSPVYTDTGLNPETQYTYTVTMRDTVGNSGSASSPSSATTQATPDTDPPVPNPATWASVPAPISDTEISMTATTGSDASGPVEYYFEETSGNPGGADSGWQTSPSYTNTGLNAGTQYTYRVQMRDSLNNIGGWSDSRNATTTGGAPLNIIGINIGGNGSLLPADETGVFPESNWNCFSGVTDPSSSSLVDNSGNSVTGMSFSATGQNQSFNDFSSVHKQMMSSWIKLPTINLTGIPYDSYDLVLYYDSWAQLSNGNSSVMSYALSSGGSPISTVYAVNMKDFRFEPDVDPDWDAFIAASVSEADNEVLNGDGGFHLIVTGLTNANLDIVVTTVSGTPAGINGIQIVDRGSVDSDPPMPNPATFATAPYALSDTEISMVATTGTDPSGPVEYFFDETSGNPGGDDSGWIASATYTDSGLQPGMTYTYTVTLRDALDNQGSPSTAQSAMTDIYGPKLTLGVTTAYNGWTTIALPYTYTSMIVIATPAYTETDDPMVVRIQNAANDSFDIRVDPAGGTAPTSVEVHYIVVEAGVYTVAGDGVKMEAGLFNSTVTDRKGSWSGQAITPVNGYTSPVVFGQVMSYNDAAYSSFWCSDGTQKNPPTGSSIHIGKMISEDTVTTRADETLGYVIIETGSGTINGIPYTTALGLDTVKGITNAPPYVYSLSGVSGASVAIATQAAMDGGDGSRALLYGTGAVSDTALILALDEDLAGDTERAHTDEQVGYIIFSY